MPTYRLNNLKLAPDAPLSALTPLLAEKLPQVPATFKIVKKSLDARNKAHVHFVYAIEFESAAGLTESADLQQVIAEAPLDFSHARPNWEHRPVVVGSGPAGMMAALCLAEAGAKPLIIERGPAVTERQAAVKKFWQQGILSPEANVQFGEGGAGTFSDGKLMTGIKKDKFTAKVLEAFVQAGAPEEILYLAKPHIGTDKLVTMVQNIRRKVEHLGGEYRFNHKLEDIIVTDGKLAAAVIRTPTGKEETISTNHLILALGHSARDTFRMLYNRGLLMTQKPFAIGCRIEHKQTAINLAQYGAKFHDSPYLGAADYKLAVHLKDNRSVYTFCMCPGGTVVGATGSKGHVVTNGMSEFARDKENANAALLVNVDKRDFGSEAPLAGMEFQERLEQKAFELGGKNYNAPVQMVGDFLKGQPSRKTGSVKPSYLPGVTPADFKQLFPKELYQALQQGITEMDKKLRGFADKEAVLTAVETRSSSPVRMERDKGFMSNIAGVYPIGEGAGYAGGITSAAADGVKLIASLLIE